MENFRIVYREDQVVVGPEGELTRSSYPEFETSLRESLSGNVAVEFDMSKVDFVDSSGVVFMLRMRELLEGRNLDFVFSNLNDNAREMLLGLKLEKILRLGDRES